MSSKFKLCTRGNARISSIFGDNQIIYETNHRKERNDGKDTPLTVTEQHTHGIDLHRNTPGIPQGIDAAVAEGRLDLKVKNNTAYTFQIQISVDKYHMRGKVLSDAKLRTAAG